MNKKTLKPIISSKESGKRLQKILDIQGKTQRQLIEDMKDDYESQKGNISNLINGNKPMTEYKAVRIAKALNINPLYLLGYIATPNDTYDENKKLYKYKDNLILDGIETILLGNDYTMKKSDYYLDHNMIEKKTSSDSSFDNPFYEIRDISGKAKCITKENLMNLIEIFIRSIDVLSVPEEYIGEHSLKNMINAMNKMMDERKELNESIKNANT